jgi:hypothetical protein
MFNPFKLDFSTIEGSSLKVVGRGTIMVEPDEDTELEMRRFIAKDSEALRDLIDENYK